MKSETSQHPRPQRSSWSPELRHGGNADKLFVAPCFLSSFLLCSHPYPVVTATRGRHANLCANSRAATKFLPQLLSQIQTHSARSHSCNTSKQQPSAATLHSAGRWHKQMALPARTIQRQLVDRQAWPYRGASTDQAAAVARVRRSDDAALRRRSRRSSTRRMRACMRRWATCIS